MSGTRNWRRSAPRHKAHGGDKREQQKAADRKANAPERTGCPVPHKRSYPGRKEAKAALKAVGKQGEQGRLHAYRCSGCQLFHLGTARLKPGPAPELT